MLLELLMMAAGTTAAPAEAIRFKSDSALVSDALGRPLFRGSAPFLFELGGNPKGQVIRYDATRRRVLISAGAPEYWIDCAEIEPVGETCAPLRRRGAAHRGAGGSELGNAFELGRGVPSCPGDPRCPRRD